MQGKAGRRAARGRRATNPASRTVRRAADRRKRAGAAVLETERARNLAGKREASRRRRGRSRRGLREASGEAVASAAGRGVDGNGKRRRRQRNTTAAGSWRSMEGKSGEGGGMEAAVGRFAGDGGGGGDWDGENREVRGGNVRSGTEDVRPEVEQQRDSGGG